MFFRRKKKARDEAPSSAPSSSGDDDGSDDAVASATTTQFLTGEASKDRRSVQVLLEAIARVSESRDLQSLLVDIVDRSIEVTGAERGLLLLREAGEGDMQVRVARMRGGRNPDEEPRFSTTIAKKVLDEVQALRATVHSESEALELGKSVYDLKLRAVMCVPLATPETTDASDKQPLGVLYVDSRAATRQFGQGDLALFAALAQHISIALENTRLHVDSLEKVRLQQSLELASTIQRDLMPQVPTDLDDWDVHGWYAPAESTAGDFYDFVPVKGSSLAIAVGDVTGHGIGPALITAAAQASMRSYLRLVSDPGEVLTLLNQDLCERVQDGRFVTLFLAMLSADGTLDSLNAGHALPFVYRASSGTIETIGRGGPALGMIEGERFEAHPPIKLDSGDVLLIYTDGLTEARDPEDHESMLGEEGVKEAFAAASAAGKTSKEVCLEVVERAMKLSRGICEDDITVVAARRL